MFIRWQCYTNCILCKTIIRIHIVFYEAFLASKSNTRNPVGSSNTYTRSFKCEKITPVQCQSSQPICGKSQLSPSDKRYLNYLSWICSSNFQQTHWQDLYSSPLNYSVSDSTSSRNLSSVHRILLFISISSDRQRKDSRDLFESLQHRYPSEI